MIDMTCTCNFCVWHRKFESVLKDVPEQHHEFFTDMADMLIEAQSDADYYRAILDGVISVRGKDNDETVCKQSEV